MPCDVIEMARNYTQRSVEDVVTDVVIAPFKLHLWMAGAAIQSIR